MKRSLIFLILVFCIAGMGLSARSSYSKAVGGAFSYGLDTGTGGSGTFLFSIPQVPFTMVGVSLRSSGDSFNLGITDDYWFYHDNLTGILNLYMGIGFYGGIASYDNEVALDFGGRVPIGLQAFLLKPLELFIEIAPTAYANITPTFSFPQFSVQGAFGVRFWF